MKSAVKKISPLGFPWECRDPFLFCAYHKDYYPKGNANFGPAASLQGRNLGQDFTLKDGWRMYHGLSVPGFPVHPHRGFETITIAKQGVVDHSDSLGAAGRFSSGDVQWMTAGKGVQHSEMFPLLNRDKANTLEIFQIWLNLPRAKKMVDPHFKMLWAEDIPILRLKDKNNRVIEIKLIAGECEDRRALKPAPESWAADPAHGVNIWTIHLEAGARWTLPPAGNNLNRSLYFYQGTTLEIDNNTIRSGHLIDLHADMGATFTNGAEDAFLLFLQGLPIDEPVVQHGPFVMNTAAEIQETIRDYQRTQFGGWPWPRQDNIHPAEQGRFARYADGSSETRDS